MKNKSLAILGTASNVGKSSVAAAIMNYYTNLKYNVAPFKALNVTSNIGVSKEQLPMAQSQIIQAQACNVEPSVFFNPVLIKPTTTGMEMYLNGKLVNNVYDKSIMEQCIDNCKTLINNNDLVVFEGSGSCAELNLKEKDLANFPLIKKLDVPVLLVANIENCGVFANVYGTLALLDDEERSLVKGIIINKYHGDVEYFNEAREIIEKITNKPVIGVLPFDTTSKSFEEMWEKIMKNIDIEQLNRIIKGEYNV